MKKLIIALIILVFGAFIFFGLNGDDGRNVQNITTTYDTNCSLDMNEGMVDGGVEGHTQHLVYGDGMMGEGHFISMPESEAAELIQLIQTGEERMYKDMKYYHFEEKELANAWGAYGTHLKLKTVSEMNIGYIESPITDEVIIIIGGSEAMYNCFQSIKWGNTIDTEEPTETDSLTDTTTTTNTSTPTEEDNDKTYDSIEDAQANGDYEPSGDDKEDYYSDYEEATAEPEEVTDYSAFEDGGYGEYYE